MNQPTVIYHSADYDGIFCREIAKHFLPDSELIGWNFGDTKIKFPKTGQVYILDLSPDCLEAQLPSPPNTDCKSRMVWIDHHKTSIETYASDIHGYRIDGVAACRLAWQWFKLASGVTNMTALPAKEDFIQRCVSEPLAVRLAGEYDIWDKRDPRAELMQFGIRAQEMNESDWRILLSLTDDGTRAAEVLCDNGRKIQSYQQKTDASICKNRTWLMKWEGLTFLCVNSARFNSLFFASKDTPENGHDALMGFCFDGKCWLVSLYHAKHRTDLDLSEIAKKYSGGGHKGACGFTCSHLPFIL